MKRLSAILLLLLFSFPLIAPLFASAPHSNLPICCRRTGQHHCVEALQSFGHLSAVSAPCPKYHSASINIPLHPIAPGTSPARIAGVLANRLDLPLSNDPYEFDPCLSLHNRGPPTPLA